MALHITPQMLAAAYDFLCTTPPFRGWSMPHSDLIEFRVTADATEHGHYNRFAGTDHHWIAISSRSNGYTGTVIMFLAHEMIHLHQALKKLETRRAIHNADFHRKAKTVCAAHGWDLKLFV
jgi:hypothetical protein